jgi:CMP-N,N'-diacetyllegionaminic acid synthase
MSMVAIIPARSGSKGVPGKNISLLGGHPLIAFSIAAAKMTPGIDRVIVSTDSAEYAAIAKKYGAETPFLRPADISDDKSTDIDLFIHSLNWFIENEKKVPEFLMHLRPTTPLRDPNIMQKAIELFHNKQEASSLRSGHLAPESPFKWFLKDELGYFKGLRDDLTPEKVNLPRQSFPTVYMPDGYVDIVRSSCILNEGSLHGNHMLVFESPYCVEVDTKDDFNYLEFQLEKESSPLLIFLNSFV